MEGNGALYIYIYHSEHYGLSFFGPYGCLKIIIFKYKVSFFCIHFHSHAPTDTNRKNLELAPPQSVTTTRLDQLVYSPNYYIQIFSSLEVKSPTRLAIALWELAIQVYTFVTITIYSAL